MPAKPVLITFDDGHNSVYEKAFPILKQHGFTGNLFLIANLINTKNYLTESQVNEMTYQGFDIGSHTLNHKNINSLEKLHDAMELVKSKNKIEKIFGQKINFFAYPYGFFDKKAEEDAKSAGYLGSFTIIPGMITRETNRFALYRFQITKTDVFNLDIFKRIIAGENNLLTLYYRFGIAKYLKLGLLQPAEIEANNLLKINSQDSYALQTIRIIQSAKTNHHY